MILEKISIYLIQNRYESTNEARHTSKSTEKCVRSTLKDILLIVRLEDSPGLLYKKDEAITWERENYAFLQDFSIKKNVKRG